MKDHKRRWSVPGQLLAALLFVFLIPAPALAQPVHIRVDAARTSGPVRPFFRYFGYDEPNYTYMPHGKKLVRELAELSREPVYIRTHFMLASGDGKPSLKMGLDQRLHRRRRRQTGLRLDDRRARARSNV